MRRPDDTVMRVRDLIQERAGVEIPASGSWTIPAGQPISVERRGSLRTEKIAFHTTHGALTVSPDVALVTLELGLSAPEVDAKTPLMIGFEGGLSSADRMGRWRFDGTVTIDGTASLFELELAYQGVYARGAVPVAWLTLAEACLATEEGRRGRRRGLRVSGDINAERDAGGGAAARVVGDRAALMEQAPAVWTGCSAKASRARPPARVTEPIGG